VACAPSSLAFMGAVKFSIYSEKNLGVVRPGNL
jgi:hypothetical protein